MIVNPIYVKAGLLPLLVVTAPTGSTVTATNLSKMLTAQEESGKWTFGVPEYGTWIVTATQNGESATATVVVDQVQQYTVRLSFFHIYGVQWDGGSSSVWSRTDEAETFTDPVPSVNNSAGSSPFDNCMPWSGMQKVTDSKAGSLVSIPKFWYKWTRSGNIMKLQIADRAVEGFSVSPAHQDRGDGKGERDTVYIGRYHCNSSYKSVTRNTPKVNISRATARSGISAIGSAYWQMDYAMLWTIWMLYLVEFADWDSQTKIGYGCGGATSSPPSVGASDSMPYHTGTVKADRATAGVGCQYRWIEDLWGNVFDWCDGIYFYSSYVYGIKDPSQFSDTANGTRVGSRPTTSGIISKWTTPSTEGFEWLLFPSTVQSSMAYVKDHYSYGNNGRALYFGGNTNNTNWGLFYLRSDCGSSDYYSGTGCRLMKLL